MPAQAERSESFDRVARALAERGHPYSPVWLAEGAHTAQRAADALGVALGQIAKSIVFRRREDDRAVLVVAAGDRRVDVERVAAIAGEVGRADADFVKRATGFSIGGVAPVGHCGPVLTLVDRSLFRFDRVWAAAGHPKGVFPATPQELAALARAPVEDLAA